MRQTKVVTSAALLLVGMLAGAASAAPNMCTGPAECVGIIPSATINTGSCASGQGICGTVQGPAPDNCKFTCIQDPFGWSTDKVVVGCATRLNKAVAKLTAAGAKCTAQAASAAVAGKPDPEADCRAAARAKFDAVVAKLSSIENCPATCVEPASLADEVETLLDRMREQQYCD